MKTKTERAELVREKVMQACHAIGRDDAAVNLAEMNLCNYIGGCGKPCFERVWEKRELELPPSELLEMAVHYSRSMEGKAFWDKVEMQLKLREANEGEVR